MTTSSAETASGTMAGGGGHASHTSSGLPIDVFAKLVEEELGLPIGSVTPEARLIEDLGLDSLQMLDLLLLLDAIDARLDSEDLARISRVGDLHRRVVEHLKLCQLRAGLVCESGSGGVCRESPAKRRRPSVVTRLLGTRTRQRPLGGADYEFLYALMQGCDGVFFRRHGRGPNPDQFAKELSRGALVQHVVLDRVADSPIGLISARDADLRRGIVHLEFVVAGRLQGQGWPFEACMLFIDHLFRSWPLRKIYAEVLAHEVEDVASGIGRLFVREGILAAHEYVDGSWVDVHILSLFRDRWDQDAPRILRGLVVGSGGVSEAKSADDVSAC
jgi:acyl carrier protein